jgi:diguanylate cyclase (GGDEF)-like protein
MLKTIAAAAIPAAGWAVHARLLNRQLDVERHDPLSGLWTRRAWMRRTDRLIEQRRITTVLFLDLDGFKPVNDTFGHEAGDAVLRAMGARLADHVAQHGGPHTVCSRLGGDEFVAAATVTDPQAFVDGLTQELARPLPWPGGPLAVTASIGLVHLVDLPRPSASTALKAADEAMYAVKKARGRMGRRRRARGQRRPALVRLLMGRAA